MKIKDVKQLPADFQPANTSPQLNGPYPGRNATRGYLVGEDSAEPARKRHHFIYEQEPKLDPWGGSRAEYEQEREAERAAFQAKLDQNLNDIQGRQAGHTASLYDRPKQEPKRDTASGEKQQSAGSADQDDFVAPHGDAKQELELFAAGEKPAAIVNAPHFGLWKRLIDTGRYVLRPLTGEGGQQSGFVIGQPGEDDRVSKIQALVQNATDAGLKGDFRAYQNSNYHRWLGRLLGYPAAAIERFIANYFRDTEDLAKQRVDEQNTVPSRRMPRIGDTLQWRTMKDPTTRTGTVLDIKGFDVTVKPKRLPGETVYPRPMGLNLANKQLTYRVIPAELSMTQPGGWTPQTPLEGAEVSEVYNPLDAERREQRAMDRERQQFKRDELEFELGGEEERMRAYNEGTFYLRINGRIWRRNGEPVAFQGRERARRAGQTIKDRDPQRDVVITRSPQDKSTIAEGQDPTYEDILSSLQRKLGDYLQDVATAVKKDPDLIDKLPQDSHEIQAVKTIRTDDGHEIKIHGNEDDGFRISIRNRDIQSQFRDLDEAVMACEMYCARRRTQFQEQDYLPEKKDACYHKVKSRYKVWPSAYASGALVQCRKKGAKNWGSKS